VVQSQPWQIVLETVFQKNPSQKRAGGVAQGVGPEFKHQYNNNKSKQLNKKRLTNCNWGFSSV
jgi:hypothetical protein